MSFLATAVLLAATTKKSSSSTFLLIILVVVAAGYFLFLRPQQQKARKAREQGKAVDVGDEILTVGGIVGRVVDVTAERITIVTGADSAGMAAEGSEPTRLVMVKAAIARKIEPVVAGDEVAPDPFDDEPSQLPRRTDEESPGEGTGP